MTLERAEQRGAVTITTLKRPAEALDCTLVYALVPNKSLDSMILARAERVASVQLARGDHHMRMENQAVDESDQADELRRLVDELLTGNLGRLWDEP
ncbi:MAG: hypothetical protein ACLQVD_18525 [Capsulimonadaceae bacterium]